MTACAQPETKPLDPYTLADGRTYQDVITIGTNGKGTSPTVTSVQTYALVDGPKGSPSAVLKPVASASGSQVGFYNALLPTIGAGVLAAAVVSESETEISNENYIDQSEQVYASDVRVKTDIVRVANLSNGIPIYSYRYTDTLGDMKLDTETTYIGVLAQDLTTDYPEAVVLGDDGFYRVNYQQIGFHMLTLEQWNALDLS